MWKNQLSPTDRNALLLRFFENRSLAEIGERLGFGESGASRRISRALEKLRIRLAKRGIATTAVALTAALSAHGVQAAPAGMVAALSSAALSSAAAPLPNLVLLKLQFVAWHGRHVRRAVQKSQEVLTSAVTGALAQVFERHERAQLFRGGGGEQLVDG